MVEEDSIVEEGAKSLYIVYGQTGHGVGSPPPPLVLLDSLFLSSGVRGECGVHDVPEPFRVHIRNTL